MIMLAAESEDSFTVFEANLMKEITEVNVVLFTVESEIRNFRKIILAEESRQSLLHNTNESPSFLNRPFVAPPLTNQIAKNKCAYFRG